MRKLLIAATAASGLAGITAVHAAPVTESFDASVYILEQITLAQLTALDFGRIDPPVGANATVTVPADGSATTVIGGSADFVGDTGNAGELAATGEPSETFTATEAPGTCDDANVTLDSIELDAPAAFDASGNASIDVGGVLTITPAAAGAGTVSCSYDVTAAY